MGNVDIEIPAVVLVADSPFGLKVGFQDAFVPHRNPPNDAIHHHQISSAFCAADSYHLGWAVEIWLRSGVDSGAGTSDPDPMALDSPELGMNVELTAVLSV